MTAYIGEHFLTSIRLQQDFPLRSIDFYNSLHDSGDSTDIVEHLVAEDRENTLSNSIVF